ncbi:RNA-binding domain-containing protein [Clostridium sp. MB05]|uniref:RNA-binding domain-containing protein n=3 Tax=Clostridium TaxID=1485 RepID=UPI003981D3B1
MIENEKKIFSIDFHVHTPESKCYNRNGEEENDAYKELLVKIREANLDAVCITDHNSINGYRKLNDMIRDINIKLEIYNKLDISILSEDIKKEIEELNMLKNIFDRVKFFPGVEFTTQDQIHMIIIFDEKLNVASIEEFIYRGGYEQVNQGKDENGVLSKWTVIDLMNEVSSTFKEKAIVIAAHVDRKKGIWESLDKSIYRANILKSQNLMGITYNTHSTKEVIRNVFNNKEYKREAASPIAFFQCSDFHNNEGDRIGTPRAYFKINSLEFNDLRSAFFNPDEYISSPAPMQTMSIIKQLIENEENILVDSFKDKIDEICKSVCALSNGEYGNILIGVDKYKNPVGVEVNKADLESLKASVIELVNPKPNIEFETYNLGKYELISLRVNGGEESLYWYNDECYFVENRVSKKAHPSDILRHVQDKMANKYNDILTVNKNKLKKISDLLLVYNDGVEVIQYINNFEKYTISISDIIELELIERATNLYSHRLIKFEKTGNVILLCSAEPRIKDAVYRFTPEVHSFSMNDIENMQIEKFGGEKIIISNSGVVHYDNSDDRYIFTTTIGLVLKVKEIYSNSISTKFISAFLKSKALFYYVYLLKGTFNIFKPDVFNSLRIPTNIPKETTLEIDNLVDKIIEIENEFVQNMNKRCIACEDKGGKCSTNGNEYDDCESYFDNHNKKIYDIMQLIDLEIYSLLSIDEETQLRIEQVLDTAFSDMF